MDKIGIKKLVLGLVSTNCYIVSNTETKEAIVIDPADNAQMIIDYMKENSMECKAILLTHGHFDHMLAACELANTFQVDIYAHEEEKELLMNPELNLSVGMGMRQVSFEPTKVVRDGDELQLAQFCIQVYYTPGHTKGGVCYNFVEEKCLFSGDTLFLESVGRTDLPTGNVATLLHSIKSKLMTLEDDIKVYPGHGPSTSIGYEKENNPYVNEDTFWG